MIFARQIQPRQKKKMLTTAPLLFKEVENQQVCTRAHVCKSSSETSVTNIAKLCSRDESHRASCILGNGTLARLKFILLTCWRLDIAFLMFWVSLAQRTKVQVDVDVVYSMEFERHLLEPGKRQTPEGQTSSDKIQTSNI